jgi:hypothetical protein
MFAGFVSYLSGETLRHWVQVHPYPIFIALPINLFADNSRSYTFNIGERYRKLASRRVIGAEERSLRKNAIVRSGIDTRFDQVRVDHMREGAEGDTVWLTASLSRISRHLGKLLRAMVDDGQMVTRASCLQGSCERPS